MFANPRFIYFAFLAPILLFSACKKSSSASPSAKPTTEQPAAGQEERDAQTPGAVGNLAPAQPQDHILAYEQQLAAYELRLQQEGLIFAQAETANRSQEQEISSRTKSTTKLHQRAPKKSSRSSETKPASSPRPTTDATAGAQLEQGESRCQRICSLAAAICQLETQICELAEHHVDEERYTQLCERAEADCKTANEGCSSCQPE